MKIGFAGLELPEGKIKYQDANLLALQDKDHPKKVSPFFVEFIHGEFVQSDVIVISEDDILDLLIPDMEKIESRLSRADDDDERVLMEKCLEALEAEIPLCDMSMTDGERRILKALAPLSFKPVVKIESDTDVNTIMELAFEKANYMFFYTSGTKESHAWLVKKGSNIVACADTIHSDLARGFIRGDVVGFEDYMNCHNFNECKSKGLAKLTDRDYVVQPGEIIEIRFNV